MEKISNNAFSRSITSTLTNEIPHLSVFNLLNRQLKNVWSKDLLGEFHISYGDLSSEKTMNGFLSDLYGDIVENIVDVTQNKIVRVTYGKPSFSISGAFETEMDYLMHEKARYLTKLYPDDFNTMITLTEAERQSYFNEALHMVHSYFDTSQIDTYDDTTNFLLREKFCEAITPIRSYTGTVAQEKFLCKLVDFRNNDIYTGLNVYRSDSNALVYSNSAKEELKSFAYNFFKYSSVSSENLLEATYKIFSGKIQDSLGNFFENNKTLMKTENFPFYEKFYLFSKLKNVKISDIIDACVNGNENITTLNINNEIEILAKNGEMESNFYTVFNKDPKKIISFPDENKEPSFLSFLYSRNTCVEKIVPLTGGSVDILDAENCFFIHNNFEYKNIDEIDIIETGEVSFSNDFLEAAGNLIFSGISICNNTEVSYDSYLDADSFVEFELTQDGKVIQAFALQRDFRNFKDFYSKGKTYFGYQNFEKELSLDNVFEVYSSPREVKESADFAKSFTFTTTFWKLPVTIKNIQSLKKTTLVKAPDDSFAPFLFNFDTPDLLWKLEKSGGFLELKCEVTQGEGYEEIKCNYLKTPKLKVIKNKNQVLLNDVDISTPAFVNNVFNFDIFTFVKEYTTQETNNPFAFKEFKIAIERKENFPNTLDSSILTRGLEIKKIYNLQDLILQNVDVKKTTLVSKDDTYVYCNKYFLKSEIDEVTEDLTTDNLIEKFFTKKETNGAFLYKIPGIFLDEKNVYIQESIKDVLKKNGIVRGILVDSTGEKYPISINQATTEYDKEYLRFDEDVKTTVFEKNLDKGVVLLLDPLQTVSLKESSFSNSSMRGLSKRAAYKLEDYFVFDLEWAPIKTENYNFLFENLESKNNQVYVNDGILKENTQDPKTLSQSYSCLLIDKTYDLSLNLIKDLINENKSLYLDTILQFFNHIPLMNENTVFNSQYKSYSFLKTDLPPSSISFYQVDLDVLGYEPLQKLLNFSLEESKEVPELEKIFNRREVIWGQVAWDGNIDKTVKTLRTIWAGYFSNFEIFSSKDFIPEETLVKSVSGSSNTFSTEILNYNYSYNSGNPTLKWNLTTSFPCEGNSFVLGKGIPVFNQTDALEEKAPQSVTLTDYKDLDTFFFNCNLIENNQTEFHYTTATSDLKTVLFDDLQLDYEIKNDVKVIYENKRGLYRGQLKSSIEDQGSFNTGAIYNFWALYNQVFTENSNYKCLDLLTTNINDISFNLFIEMCLYIYVNKEVLGYREEEYSSTNFGRFNIETKLGLEKSSTFVSDYLIPSIYESDLPGDFPSATDKDFISKGLETKKDKWNQFQAAKGFDREKSVRLRDVLDYIYKQNYNIPCIVRLTEDEKIVVDYFRVVKKSDNNFKIIQGAFSSEKNPDLIFSVLPSGLKSYQLKKSDAVDIFARLSENQVVLPLGCEGIFNDFGVVGVDGAFTDEYQAKVNQIKTYDYNKNGIILNDYTFSPFTDSASYREFYEDVLDLYTEDPSESADIRKCVIHFNKDHSLTNEGNLYLYDLKVPNRRSGYSKKRETQIVDRFFDAENLHLLAFQESDNSVKLLLQDSLNQTGGRIENVIETLLPVDELLDKQKIKSEKIKIGFNWVDPEAEIGYSFYKRKFIAEATLTGGDTTKVTVERLDDSFKLEDHISIGDVVEIQLLDKASTFSDGTTLSFNASEGSFKGPYRAIFEESTNNTIALGEDTTDVITKIILSGPGNLCLLTINASSGNCDISSPLSFDVNGGLAFESNGLLYFFDNTTLSTKVIGRTTEFLSGNLTFTSTPEVTMSIKNNNAEMKKGNKKISENHGWDDVEKPGSFIANAFPYKNGKIYTDTWDRYLFEDFDGSSLWLNDVDELEAFQDSRTLRGDFLDPKDYENYLNIEDASTEELKQGIRDSLYIIFGCNYGPDRLNTNSEARGEGSSSTTTEASSYTFTLETNAEVPPALNRLARLLFKVQDGATINVKTDTIYIPAISELDVPVYFDDYSESKWVKANVIYSNSNTTIDDATDDELKAFVKALSPYFYSCRNIARITGCAKNTKYNLMWDPYSASLTVLDSNLSLQNNIKIPYLGVTQPYCESDFFNDRTASSYEISNLLYLRDSNGSKSITEYVNWINTYEKINEVGAYDLFKQGNLLYLPTVFSSYANKTDEELETSFSSFTQKEEAISMIKKIIDPVYFEKWISKIQENDYLTSSFADFLSFKSKEGECNPTIICEVLDFLEKTPEAAALRELLDWGNEDDFLTKKIKGIPHLSESNNFDKLKGLTSYSLYSYKESPFVFSYESLVKTSSITINENEALIYGIINWPEIEDSAREDPNQYLGKLKNKALTSQSSDLEESVKEQRVKGIVDSVVSKLQTNFNKLCDGSYEAGERSFLIKVDLQTLEVKPIPLGISLQNDRVGILSVLSSKENGLVSLTEKGWFATDSSEEFIMETTSKEIDMNPNLIKILDACKSLNFFSGISIQDDGSITMQANGFLADTPEVYYSRVRSLDISEFRISDAVPSEDDLRVIISVKNETKDNFQFGYCGCDPQTIRLVESVFEVRSPLYADFASYDNKQSMISEDYTKPSVFDLYPTWEVIDEDKRSDFYEVDEKGEPVYITNKLGRPLLRMEMADNISEGVLILREAEDETIAMESISNETLSLEENQNRPVSRIRTVGKSFEDLQKVYKFQKIPKLVKNPRDAIIEKAYKDISFDINNETSDVLIKDSYMILSVTKKDSNSVIPESLYKTAGSFGDMNKSQTSEVCKSIEDLPEFTLQELKDGASSFFYSDKLQLLETSKVEYSTVTKTTEENEVKSIDVYYQAKVYNDLNEVVLEKKVVNNNYLTGSWKIFSENACLGDITFKAVNRTNSLPNFIPVTRYKSSNKPGKDLIYDTECNEIYIPNRGYGQALIGKYTLPKDCVFDEDKTFFDNDLKTVNILGDQFVLVDEFGNKLKDEDGNDVMLPKMLYRSFSEADTSLDAYLPTARSIEGASESALIDLSNFDVSSRTISLEKKEKLGYLNLISSYSSCETKEDSTYSLFKEELKLSAKILYSELPVDVSTSNVKRIDNDINLSTKIKETRKYQFERVPVGYKYQKRDLTYTRTSDGFSQEKNKLSCDQEGNILYLDYDGNISTTASYNPPIPAEKTRQPSACFTVSELGELSSYLLAGGVLGRSKKILTFDYRSKRISFDESILSAPILFLKDPNRRENQNINRLYCEEFNKDIVDVVFKFNNCNINFNYKTNIKKFNFAYLKNKKGECIGKIYFREPISRDDVLCFSLIG